MDDPESLNAIAGYMIAEYGSLALDTMCDRAKNHILADEAETALLWMEVARIVGHLQSPLRPSPVSGLQTSDGPSALFDRAFEATPSACLLLTRDLAIAGVTDRYLAATLTRRSDIVGCFILDVFPDNPDDANADGARNLLTSLTRVLDHGRSHKMGVQRYDIRGADGCFREKWWQMENIPVLADGKLVHVLHHIEDATERHAESVAAERVRSARVAGGPSRRPVGELTAADLEVRARELRQMAETAITKDVREAILQLAESIRQLAASQKDDQSCRV